MYPRLLAWLRCPLCGGELGIESADEAGEPDCQLEIATGTLRCDQGHSYAITGGIPRMLPGVDAATLWEVDTRTQENFSLEWDYHEIGDGTWGMQLEGRLQEYLIEPLRLSAPELKSTVLLDAGCGNGSLSVAATRVGLEVIGLDVSSGLEKGEAFRHQCSGAIPDQAHFVQGDLLAPPLAPASVDVVYSSGVLHITAEPERTFQSLSRLLRPGGRFYVWVYHRQLIVTPVVSAIRAVTTRLPPARFAKVARASAPVVLAACRIINAFGIKKYVRTRRETALALMDVFGTPHVHYHTPEEVEGWFTRAGFGKVWLCHENRRGFGLCGSLGSTPWDAE